jgi:hypothetical protein
MDGTSWSMDGGEVASGTDCTVISGTRPTPSRSFARVLASSVRLGLARCGEATPVVVSGARTTHDMAPTGVPTLSTRSGLIADEVPLPAWPQSPRLLLLWRGGWQGKPGCSIFCHDGKSSSSSPLPGEPTIVVAVALRGEEYHVVAAVEGHELETPEAEQRPRLKRLLEATHLELNGKMFVNTQRAPTWRANCRRFGPARTVNPTSKFVVACPCPDGLMQDGTQEGNVAYVISHRGARSRGYKRRETARVRARGRRPTLSALQRLSAAYLRKALDISFYRYKEMPSYTMGCSCELTWPSEKCLEPCRSTTVGVAWILLTLSCFHRRLRAI